MFVLNGIYFAVVFWFVYCIVGFDTCLCSMGTILFLQVVVWMGGVRLRVVLTMT